MARGPRPDPNQAAKGYPGRRKSKADLATERADRVAALLAAAPAPSGDAFEPPVLQDPMFAGALAVWRELAPRLRETHRLPKETRFVFVQLCVYAAEWWSAELDIAEKGHTQSVKTVAGGRMERLRPIVQIRERAFDNVLKLAERFGLTPHDMYALFKDQALVAASNPGLFDRGEAGAVTPAPTPTEPEPGGLVGAAARLRSQPPPTAH